MTGTSTFDRCFARGPAGLNRVGVRIGIAAAVAGGGMGAPLAAAGERVHRCGPCEQYVAVSAGAGQQPERAREQSDKRREGDSDKDGRRGRSGGEGRPSQTVPYDFNWGYGKGHGDARAPRPNEWQETQVFMRRYAPRRQGAVEQMPEGEAKESLKRFVFARYRGLQSLQRRDPTSYEQRLAQLRVEDQIFGIVSDWGGPNDEAGLRTLREALRTQVAQLVELDLQERQRRVESLRRELAEQTESLARDEKQRDSLVDKRVSRFADWAGRWAARRKQGEGDKRDSSSGRRPAPEAPRPNGDATDSGGPGKKAD